MSNPYFVHDTPLVKRTLARAETLNSLFLAIEAGFDKVVDQDLVNQGRATYAADTGTTNTHAVALPTAPASYTAGLMVMMKSASTTTGASTVNVDGLGVKAIKRYDGTDLLAGDIVVGMLAILVYTGTNFLLAGVHGGEVALAKSHADDAATSETNAATSASNAATSEANALSHYNSFRGVYYGAQASDPALDPLGAAINVGDWYYNTTESTPKIYTGTIFESFDTTGLAANLASGSDAAKGAALVGFGGTTVRNIIKGLSVAQLKTVASASLDDRTTLFIGYSTAGIPGFEGYFELDKSDSTTAGDDAVTIVANDGARWKRKFSGYVSVTWFGARVENPSTGNPMTFDNSSAFSAALAFARIGGGGALPVYVPGGIGAYRFTSSIALNGAGDTLIGDSPESSILYFDGSQIEGLEVSNDRVSVSDLYLVGSSVSSQAIRLAQNASLRTLAGDTFKNIYITGFNEAGIVIQHGISNVWNNVYISNNAAIRPQVVQNISAYHTTGIGTIKIGVAQDGDFSSGGVSYTNQNQTFTDCRIDAVERLLNIGAIGLATTFNWKGGLLQGGGGTGAPESGIYLRTADSNIICTHMERDATSVTDRIYVQFDTCRNTTVKNAVTADVEFIGANVLTGVENCWAEGYIIGSASDKCFVRDSSYGSLSNGVSGGKLKNYSVSTILRNVYNTANLNFELADNLSDRRQLLFRSGMETWANGLPCGFFSSSGTVTLDGVIFETSASSAKVVTAGEETAPLAFNIGYPIGTYLRRKKILVRASVYNVGTEELVTVTINKNSGNFIAPAGITPLADAWYPVLFTYNVPDDTNAMQIEFRTSAAGTFYVDSFEVWVEEVVELPAKNVLATGTATPEIWPNGGYSPPILQVDASGTAITDLQFPEVGKDYLLWWTGARTLSYTGSGGNFVTKSGADITGGLDDVHLFRYMPDGRFYEI